MTSLNPSIRAWMTPNPVTVDPDTSVPDAMAMMKKGGFRRLLVMKNGDLVGIVTDRDLREAMPSDATSLSVWEINFLIARLLVKEIMTTRVISIDENASLEKAAELMLEYRIGGMPVVVSGTQNDPDGGAVVGIVTTSDVLRAFIAREKTA